MYFNIEAELGSQIQYQFSQESLDIGWDMSRYGWSHSRLFKSRWEFMFQKNVLSVPGTLLCDINLELSD
jgi:hypothetical protein